MVLIGIKRFIDALSGKIIKYLKSLQKLTRAHWLIFIANRRTNHEFIIYVKPQRAGESGQFDNLLS